MKIYIIFVHVVAVMKMAIYKHITSENRICFMWGNISSYFRPDIVLIIFKSS